MIVSGSLILAGAVLGAWLYWLTGRVQRILDHAEGAVDLADRTLAALPVRRSRSDGLLRWLHDAPAVGVPPVTVPQVAVPPVTVPPAVRLPLTPPRAVPGPRPSPMPRTDTAELSAAVDAGLRRITERMTEQPSGRTGGRHAAPRPGRAPAV